MKNSANSGFSLIQISILLTIAALVMVAVLPTSSSTVKYNASSVTKMNAIMTALRDYQSANGQLPCPADPTLATSANNYGVAAANPGTGNDCTSGTPAAAYADSTNHIAIGMVPVKTLGLSYDYALDAYGRDITYAVDTNATNCQLSRSQPGSITVTDNGVNHSTVVALVSHGKDGYGAWLPVQSGTATRFNTGSTDASQAANAQVTAGTTNAKTPFTSFINKPATPSFDDLVVYKSSQWNINSLPSSYTLVTCPGPYIRELDITYTPSSTLTNFPMLFSGTYSYLATTAHGGNVQNANGYDITFSQDAANLQPLNFERVSYNATTGAVIFWVQVPSISSSGSNKIYLRYNDTSITTDQSQKNATWDSNFMAVWHLDETSGTQYDSTSNSSLNNLTNVSVSTEGGTTTSKIGGADYFNSTSNLVSNSSSNSTLLPTDLTLETWIRYTSNNSGGQTLMYKTHSTSPWLSYQLYLDSSAHACMTWTNTSQAQPAACSSSALSTGTWYHIAGTYNSATSTLTMYLNGASAGTNTTTGTMFQSDSHFLIGTSNASMYPHAYIDEARLSNMARSSAWIAAEYNSENSPSTFYSIGSAAAR